MMKKGTFPTSIDHRDRDYHKSFRTFGTTQFPTEFFTDAGIDMPAQALVNNNFDPPVPPLPEGCTDYAQSELATDLVEGRTVRNPALLEAVTHANELGGYDIRKSLVAAKGLGWFSGFYNIKSAGFIDYFDSFRLAQIGGLPERRSITWGTPWFPSWEAACNPSVNPSGIMPMPTDAELAVAWKQPDALPWHNSKLDGWTSLSGVLVYRDKSWQGTTVGKNGFVYFPREVINRVMSIQGTVAFTATNQTPQSIFRIDTTAVQWITSLIRQLFGV